MSFSSLIDLYAFMPNRYNIEVVIFVVCSG
jgi:hypothetical protein